MSFFGHSLEGENSAGCAIPHNGKGPRGSGLGAVTLPCERGSVCRAEYGGPGTAARGVSQSGAVKPGCEQDPSYHWLGGQGLSTMD